MQRGLLTPARWCDFYQTILQPSLYEGTLRHTMVPAPCVSFPHLSLDGRMPYYHCASGFARFARDVQLNAFGARRTAGRHRCFANALAEHVRGRLYDCLGDAGRQVVDGADYEKNRTSAAALLERLLTALNSWESSNADPVF